MGSDPDCTDCRPRLHCQGVQDGQQLHRHRLFADVQAQTFTNQPAATRDAACDRAGTPLPVMLSSSTRNGIEPRRLHCRTRQPPSQSMTWGLSWRKRRNINHYPVRSRILQKSQHFPLIELQNYLQFHTFNYTSQE